MSSDSASCRALSALAPEPVAPRVLETVATRARKLAAAIVLALTAATVTVPMVACGGEDAPPPDSSATPQPFALEADGAWIGNAICYGPHRDGQRPGVTEPSAEELSEDLQLMSPHWKLLRIYGAGGLAETLLQTIREDGFDMKVVLGVWIAPDAEADNHREIDTAIRLAKTFPDIVVAVSVGNETQIHWSAHRVPAAELIAYVREARGALELPVTVADDFNFWNKPESRAVAAEVDFITMHAHPMWNGVQLEDALPWLREQLEAVQAFHPERVVVVGETGWATQVHDEGEQAELIKGVPGEAEQKAFYDAVRAWARQDQQPVFFFEAFDENWKGGTHPNEVEKHWGLFRADRTPKAALAEGESEVEREVEREGEG